MKKRSLAWMLTAAMVLSAVPVSAASAGFETGGILETPETGFEVEAPEVANLEEETLGEVKMEQEPEGEDTETLEVSEDAASLQEIPEEKSGLEPVTGNETERVMESGTSGGTTWTLTGDTLRVSGKGAMASYGVSGSSPLNDFKEQIRNVIIEEGVTGIGDNAFFDLYNMETIALPDSLKTIGGGAFRQCGKLQSVHIPKGVKKIGYEAFAWSGVGPLTFDDGVKDLVLASNVFNGSGLSGSLTIPSGVIEMGNEVFRGCGNLTSVKMEPGVKKIGFGLFRDCGSLISAQVAGTLEEDGGSMFSGCSKLQKVVLEEGITKIGGNTFYVCRSLTDVTLPSTLKEIPSRMFTDCSALKRLEIPEGVEGIAADSYNGTFYGCNSLEEVRMPSTMKYIGSNAFRGCEALTAVVLNEGLETISGQAFLDCSNLRDINIPSTVRTISWRAFQRCSALTEITLPDGLTAIEEDVFDHCASLACIRIPGSVKTIGNYAFGTNTSLSEIYFEGDAPGISSSAFVGVYADAYYPTNVKGWTADKRQNYGGSLTWKGYAPDLRVPGLVSAVNTSTGIKVTWNPVSGADGYAVFRKTGSGSYTYVGRTANTNYNDGTGKAGASYTYTVRAFRGSFTTANANKYNKKYWSGYDSIGLLAVRLTTGTLTSVTNAASSINLKWGKVTGAKGYNIFRKTGSGRYIRIAQVGSSTLSYKDKNIANGATYTYAVRAYNGSSAGTYVGVKRYRLSRSLISSAKKSASGQIAVKWGKNARVTGYKISYTTGSTTKTKTVTGNANTSTTLTGLSKGKTYTIKVRGYKTISGKKHYSAWSTEKKVLLS